MPAPSSASHRVLEAIAGRIGRFRDRLDPGRQFYDCAAEDVAAIAHDLGMNPRELMTQTRRGPDAARLLNSMLAALHIAPKELANREPVVMRDLQRVCAACDYKRQCERDLLEEHDTEHCLGYCPNAYTLEMLRGSGRSKIA